MVRVDSAEALNSYLLKITFKRWAKLWAPGNIRLRSVSAARRIEDRDYRIGSALYQIPLPSKVRTFAVGKRYSLKKRLAYKVKLPTALPSTFLLECYNPNPSPVSVSFAVRSVGRGSEFPYQKLISLAEGFNRVQVPVAEIAAIVDLVRPFNIEIIPNNDSNHLTLFFGLMDFVDQRPLLELAGKASAGEVGSKVKCVVWDLDHTIWNGTLVEDGPEKLRIKPQIKDVLEELDRRGILLSIASKNNPEDAAPVLRRMEIHHLFLAPQISWGPKSAAVQAIAKSLNIGLDTILFVDDSPFEREEVSKTVPAVRVLDAQFYSEIPGRNDCDVPVTTESRMRRSMYRVEEERQALASKFSGDYSAFLRDCHIRLKITSLCEDNIERVHELTQRTNQMNFSGNRYDREVLRKIMESPSLDTYVMEVEDRFGAYGIVGFSIVDNRQPTVTDLMFSCRIQSKRIEHAFLSWAIGKYIAASDKDVWAIYRKTDRNAPSGRVFADLGLREVETIDGVSRLVFHRDQTISDDEIVEVNVRTASVTV